MRRVVLLFALAAVLTGCSETTTGTPSAGGETPTAGSSSTKAPTSSKAPVTRPKKIDLKTLGDPCAFFYPAAVQTQFGLRNINVSDQTGLWPGAKACGASTEDRSALYIHTAIVSEGVEPKYSSGAGVTKEQVAGFTAYQKTDDVLKACTLAIDVADGQMLMMMAFEPSAKDPQIFCPKVKAMSEAVLAGS
ncbi:DUF3558 domain-containing protein [Lentzea tibetensis]|uniref:DUF3558 domain-containing protein n=1 Tax=Lentzea tibetensis TaxID=2591470 RepID=A0A563F013_9PSEU|nr:DUF3558 domain-containing protein [Lentzea tibetensis]TWP53081.1 DUF3558 domain-containing protein [Lentzea tibetensis]